MLEQIVAGLTCVTSIYRYLVFSIFLFFYLPHGMMRRMHAHQKYSGHLFAYISQNAYRRARPGEEMGSP